MTEQQTVELARKASDVIDNEAYKQAMAGLKAQIVAQWKECPVRDTEGALPLCKLIA